MRTQLITIVCLAAMVVGPSSVWASSHSVRGVTFDSDNAVTTGAIVEGGYAVPGGLGLFNNKHKLHFFDASGATVPNHTASLIRRWPDGTYPAARTNVTLGFDPELTTSEYPFTASHMRDTMQLTWGGAWLENTPGSDLAVFEQATQEAFAVRARVVGADFTGWYFNKPGPRLNNDGTLVGTLHGAATLFDLADMGVADGVSIDMLEIRNMLATDSVSDPGGFGFVTFDAPPGGYLPRHADGTAFAFRDFDPDIEYVVGLHNVRPALAPEPGTCALLASQLLGLGGLALRRRRRK